MTHILLEEDLNRDQVRVRVSVGSSRETCRLTGTLIMGVDAYLVLSRAMALALPGRVHRGPCPRGCGHHSHLDEVCLAALFDADGRESLCPCRDLVGFTVGLNGPS